jgi:translation elongation factor EF-Tu-like GTPase
MTKKCSTFERKCAERLSFYDFDGDNTPVIRGSALGNWMETPKGS